MAGIKGRTVDIGLNPTLAKDVPGFNRIVPIVREMKNVRYDDLGNTKKRPGYLQEWDTIIDEPIKLLIPEATGYAINRAGGIFTLGSSINNIFTLAPFTSRPTYIRYNNSLIVATGAPVIEINGVDVTLVGNEVPNAKYVVLINDYAIYLGYHPTKFFQAVPGNPKSVDTAFGAREYVIQKSGEIQFGIDYRENLLIFKDREIEVWNFRGSDPPFVRQPGAKIEIGLGAPNSVVRDFENDKIYWFGNDGNFYVMEGFTFGNISRFMRADIDTSSNPSAWEGYNMAKDNVIMWINLDSGQTLLFDYHRKRWLEDSWWQSGCHHALPFSAYMELNGKQYVGSAKYDGLVHEWSYEHKIDNGDAIRVSREFTVPLSSTGFRARVHRLNFRREANSANVNETDPKFMVRTRFDKGAWSNYEHLTLGVTGDNEPYAQMNAIGYGREMDIEIVETAATDFLLSNIYATVQRMNS